MMMMFTSVPQNYTRDDVLTDDEFAEVYSTPDDKVTYEQKYYARDYAVDKFLKTVDSALTEKKSVVDALAELPKERLESLFWGLAPCTCCWRHLHNKPVAIDSKEDSSVLDVATVGMINDSVCFCHCRAAKRFLRQAYFNQLKKD
jgi:hypothetical protein